MSAKRKLSAAAVGTESLVPSVFVNDESNQRVDRGSFSVKSVLVRSCRRRQ